MYASVRSRISGGSLLHLQRGIDARHQSLAGGFFVSDVPLICPARNSPAIFFVSRVRSSSVGSIESYSIAYPGRIISAVSSPGIDFKICQLHFDRQRRAHAIHVNFVRVQSFGFEEELVRRLCRET